MISIISQGQGSIQGTGTGTHILEVSKTSGGPWCGPTWKFIPIIIHCFNALFSSCIGLSACMSNNDQGVRVFLVSGGSKNTKKSKNGPMLRVFNNRGGCYMLGLLRHRGLLILINAFSPSFP